MAAPTLATGRLVLRQLRHDDAEALFPVLSDAEVMTWWSSGPHATVDETRDYLRFNAAEGEGHLCWAITLAGDDTALGWVILIERARRRRGSRLYPRARALGPRDRARGGQGNHRLRV